MNKKSKSFLAKICSLALAGTMLVPVTGNVSVADAASKPSLSKKTVSVTVGKTVKITVKGKKIKKTTWSIKNKKTAMLSAKKKTSVKIKGVKAGSTKVTAKVKVGKKSYTLNAAVKVKKVANQQTNTVTNAPATETPVSTGDVTGTSTENPTGGDVAATQEPTVPTEPTAEPTAVPTATPAPVVYSEDFENGVGSWYGRYSDTSVGPTVVSISTEAHSGNGALLTTGRERYWNSPGIDMADTLVAGGTYKFSLWAKVPDSDTANAKGISVRMSIEYKTSEDADTTWRNIPANKNQKILQSGWTHIEEEYTLPDSLYSLTFYVETNGKPTAEYLIDDVEITCVSLPEQYDATLPSIKDTYASYIPNFGVATTVGGLQDSNTLGFIKHHFNSITMGNEMKPDAIIKETTLKLTDEEASEYVVDDDYAQCADNKDADGNVIVPKLDFTNMDKVLQIAKENGLKVRIHSPFWHQQNPQQFFTKQFVKGDDAEYTDQATMFARESMYTKTLINHIAKSGYADVVYAYDVVNEYINMANEGTDDVNHWKFIFGTEMKTDCQYVKKAFVSAYEALEANNLTDSISLIYNDYNTYDNTDTVIELINNINAKDDLNPEGKKVCAGIGMQSHINDTSTTAEKFENAIAAFAAQGFEIQITELDVTNTGVVTSDTSAEKKAEVWAANAKMYGEIMTAILNQKKAGANITSVTIWGTTDVGSWRSTKAPLLFGSSLADKKPSFDAVINAAKNFQ